MTTITIPKKLLKEGELVIISRKEYEKLLGPPQRKRAYTQLDRDLDEAIEDVKAGRLIGPFSSAKEGLKALKRAK